MSQESTTLTREQQDAMQLAIEAQVNLLNIEFRKFYGNKYDYVFEKRVGEIEKGLVDRFVEIWGFDPQSSGNDGNRFGKIQGYDNLKDAISEFVRSKLSAYRESKKSG